MFNPAHLPWAVILTLCNGYKFLTAPLYNCTLVRCYFWRSSVWKSNFMITFLIRIKLSWNQSYSTLMPTFTAIVLKDSILISGVKRLASDESYVDNTKESAMNFQNTCV
jgi:hypothetical protein